MSQLTPMTVRALYDYMSRRYRTEIIDKRRAAAMHAMSWFIERVSGIPAKTFVERYGTTIGRRIYLPFVPGETSNGFDLWSQVVICAHEHQHVEQLQRDGWIKFVISYLASSSARAAYEADAYRTAIELTYWRRGHVPSPKAIAARLADYAASPGDIKMAETMLISAARTVRLGGVSTPASKAVIAWLDDHAPDLNHGRSAA